MAMIAAIVAVAVVAKIVGGAVAMRTIEIRVAAAARQIVTAAMAIIAAVTKVVIEVKIGAEMKIVTLEAAVARPVVVGIKIAAMAVAAVVVAMADFARVMAQQIEMLVDDIVLALMEVTVCNSQEARDFQSVVLE